MPPQVPQIPIILHSMIHTKTVRIGAAGFASIPLRPDLTNGCKAGKQRKAPCKRSTEKRASTEKFYIYTFYLIFYYTVSEYKRKQESVIHIF